VVALWQQTRGVAADRQGGVGWQQTEWGLEMAAETGLAWAPKRMAAERGTFINTRRKPKETSRPVCGRQEASTQAGLQEKIKQT